MKAIVQSGYGAPERVLSIGELEKPTPAENQVLVRVMASSINAGDWRRVRANPFFIRLMGGLRRPRQLDLGGDVAGIVEEVGPGESLLKVGDEVYGIRHGALAEYVAGQNFVRKPSNLTFEQAGTVPIAAVTALQAIQKYGNVQPGQHVLINGAGGGVGSFAVQIAKTLGADVTAVTSTGNVELVQALGADHVVDYKRENFTRNGNRYDLIIEIGGNQPIRALRRVMATGGKIVLVGAGRGRMGVLSRLLGSVIRNRLGQPVTFFIANGPYQEQLTTLREMIEAGKVMPAIDRSFAIADTAAALRYVETEQTRGKVAITVA